MRPAVHPMMNAVGGTSIHYWAQSWRCHPWDFKVRSEATRRYGAGAIPQGSALKDWPVTYEELEPFYDVIEHEVGIRAKAGIFKASSIRVGMFSRGRGSVSIRCRRCAIPSLRA